VFRSRGVNLDLLSQVADEHSQILRLFNIIAAPHGAQQLPMGEHLPGVLNQVNKQLILLRSQADLFSADFYDASLEIAWKSPTSIFTSAGEAFDRLSAARMRASNSSIPKGLVT
jgi:hypothetical protein